MAVDVRGVVAGEHTRAAGVIGVRVGVDDGAHRPAQPRSKCVDNGARGDRIRGGIDDDRAVGALDEHDVTGGVTDRDIDAVRDLDHLAAELRRLRPQLLAPGYSCAAPVPATSASIDAVIAAIAAIAAIPAVLALPDVIQLSLFVRSGRTKRDCLRQPGLAMCVLNVIVPERVKSRMSNRKIKVTSEERALRARRPRRHEGGLRLKRLKAAVNVGLAALDQGEFVELDDAALKELVVSRLEL